MGNRKFLVPIQLPADPTTALQAATKQYVDSKVGGLDSLNDVTIATPLLGQVLVYDAASAQWKNHLYAFIGGRGDNAAGDQFLRYGHRLANDKSGFMANATGGIDAIQFKGTMLGFWDVDAAAAYRKLGEISFDVTRNAAYLLAGDVIIGGSMHPGYVGMWKVGAGSGDYALIISNNLDTILNGRASFSVRINNGSDRITCSVNDTYINGTNGVWITKNGANRFWFSGNDNAIDSPNWTYLKQNGSDALVIESALVRSEKRVRINAVPGGNVWSDSQLLVYDNGSQCRLAMNTPGVAPMIRVMASEGENMILVNNPNSAYASFGGAAYIVKSSLDVKRDIRPLREVREREKIDVKPLSDKVQQPNIMHLRPVVYRPTVGNLKIKEDETTEEWAPDTSFGIQGRRERLGLVAEEVQHVLPTAVFHDREGAPWGIYYEQVLIALLDHVQQLTDLVSTQQYRIAELERNQVDSSVDLRGGE